MAALLYLLMKYRKTVRAKFIERINRFAADVELDGSAETVHVKNTGRCRELLVPGAEVILADGEKTGRKTRYDLITVYKDGLGWVNIDSQAPNVLVMEWLEKINRYESAAGDRKAFHKTVTGNNPEKNTDIPLELYCLETIRPEYTYGTSRVDFLLRTESRDILMEVKGCTLEKGGTGYFPDAPTERGIKHLRELTEAVKEGYSCYLAFVIAMPGISEVRPNMITHPAFGKELAKAEASGVKVLFLSCDVKEDEISITGCRLKE